MHSPPGVADSTSPAHTRAAAHREAQTGAPAQRLPHKHDAVNSLEVEQRRDIVGEGLHMRAVSGPGRAGKAALVQRQNGVSCRKLQDLLPPVGRASPPPMHENDGDIAVAMAFIIDPPAVTLEPRHRSGLPARANIPEDAGHDRKPLLGHAFEHVLIGRVLRAGWVRMRHPDGRHPEHFRKDLIGQ